MPSFQFIGFIAHVLTALHVTWAAPCSLSKAFGSHAVLQRAPSRAVLFGTADPGTLVTLTLGAANYTSPPADDKGVWRVALPPSDATTTGATLAFSCSSGERFAISDVLFGDLFVTSGQSNACFTVAQSFNGTEEVAASSRYPLIRTMSVAHKVELAPQLDLPGYELQWSVASPASIGGPAFGYTSAIAWFTGRDLFDALGGTVPIGLIVSCVSSTTLAAWSSPDALAVCPTYPVPGNQTPSGLYNGMIHPFTVGPMALAGFLWYQGENDADNWLFLGCGLPTMIADIRLKLGSPALPFSFVDLAAWDKTGNNFTNLPNTRLAMLNASTGPGSANVTAAMAYDLGDTSSPWPGHPRAKQPVGARLAASLLASAYGRDVVHYGPTYASATAAPASSGGVLTVRINFTPASLGRSGALLLNSSVTCATGIRPAACEAFAVKTGDGVWHTEPMAALAAGGSALELATSGVAPGAVAVATRGMFADWPLAQLFNGEGFPAVPWLATL